MEKNVKLKNKKQLAYEYIRSLIVDGTYGSGQRIIIDQTAKELGLSIIPVREAIRQLESEGLIEYKPYSGAVVTRINEGEYIDTLVVMSILEAYATALSSKYLDENDFVRLINLNKEMEEALKTYKLELFGELNGIFHTMIIEKCRNIILINEIKDAQERMNRVRSSVFTMVPQRGLESLREHDRIIDLLKKKAPFEEIERQVREHKMNTISAFQKRNNINKKNIF